jgi:hypothetical protein
LSCSVRPARVSNIYEKNYAPIPTNGDGISNICERSTPAVNANHRHGADDLYRANHECRRELPQMRAIAIVVSAVLSARGYVKRHINARQLLCRVAGSELLFFRSVPSWLPTLKILEVANSDSIHDRAGVVRAFGHLLDASKLFKNTMNDLYCCSTTCPSHLNAS